MLNDIFVFVIGMGITYEGLDVIRSLLNKISSFGLSSVLFIIVKFVTSVFDITKPSMLEMKSGSFNANNFVNSFGIMIVSRRKFSVLDLILTVDRPERALY